LQPCLRRGRDDCGYWDARKGREVKLNAGWINRERRATNSPRRRGGGGGGEQAGPTGFFWGGGNSPGADAVRSPSPGNRQGEGGLKIPTAEMETKYKGEAHVVGPVRGKGRITGCQFRASATLWGGAETKGFFEPGKGKGGKGGGPVGFAR